MFDNIDLAAKDSSANLKKKNLNVNVNKEKSI